MSFVFRAGRPLLEGRREYLAKYADKPGVEDVLGRFWSLRHRLGPPRNDVDWWIKRPFEDLARFVDGFDARPRKERRRDEHADAAVRNGARMLGMSGPYEVWWIPTHAAAQEIGRLYRGVSAKWCISTENPEYFSYTYRDREFVFMILVDGASPLPDCDKMALEIDKNGGVDVWNAADHCINSDVEYQDSEEMTALVDQAVDMFYESGLSREEYQNQQIDVRLNDQLWLRNNLFKDHPEARRKDDGSWTAEYDDGFLYGLDVAGGVDKEVCRALLRRDYQEISYHVMNMSSYLDDMPLTKQAFDRIAAPYGVTWETLCGICEPRGEEAASEVPEDLREWIYDMAWDDFYGGDEMQYVWHRCWAEGHGKRDRAVLMRQLEEQLGVQSCEYSAEKKSYVVSCRFPPDRVRTMVEAWMDGYEGEDPIKLQLFEKGEVGCVQLKLAEDSDDFDDGMLAKAAASFARKIVAHIKAQDGGSALNEGKKEYLAKYAGEPGAAETVGRFWTLRHRIRAPRNDIDWWIKRPFSDLKAFVDGFDARKRSVRRSDAHAEKAKKHGAVLMDVIDRYEIWYVPSYEAAVELGRFYKNVSTNWCISTDDPDYFNGHYRDSEFMFLIYEDPKNCPDEDLAKLALQVPRKRDGNDKYQLWDVSDDDICQNYEYWRSELLGTVSKAMKMWDKIPYNRDQYEEKAVMAYATDAAWLKDHVFYGCEDFQMADDGSVSAVFGMDDLAEALSDGRGYVSAETVKMILNGDGRLYDWDGSPEYDLAGNITAEFDEKMKPYGLSWSKVAKIAQDGEAAGVDAKTELVVAELMDDDFYGGSGYGAIYADCMSSGAEREAREDIIGQLKQLGVQSVNYGKPYLAFNCRFSTDAVLKMTKTYQMRNPSFNAFQLMAYDEDEETCAIGIEEPYHGWSGFDDDMMKEALRYFARRLIGEITKTGDLPGQTYFDFDKDYLDNPENLPRD